MNASAELLENLNFRAAPLARRVKPSRMEWTDEGIVLGVRRHGESSAIVELLTRERGRHLGLVRGGAGSRMRPLLQPGNSVSAVWRARLDEHLGTYAIEGTRLRAATLLASSFAVYGVTHLAALARLLPERDPHLDIYEMLEHTLDDFDDAGVAAVHLVRFELAMLAELGFGLDLENCAATGETADLIYVSPKSGGAVSRRAGEPFRDRLLRLPAFLRQVQAESFGEEGGTIGWSDQDLQDGFRLTGLFLLRHVLEPRGQGHSDARDGFINAVAKHRAKVMIP
jgi:DNA repair protein RecO (recombination protein O)